MRYSYRHTIYCRDSRRSKGGLETRQSFDSTWSISAADNGLSCITILATVSEKHYCKILKRTRLLFKTFSPTEFFEPQKCEKPIIMSRHKWLLWCYPRCTSGVVSVVQTPSYFSYVLIKLVREIMIRDKNGKSPWVKARKKPGRKSQTSKYFDDEWRMEKKILPKRTRADGLCNLRCSPSRNHRQVPPPRV